MTDLYRRTVLTLASAGLATTSGCLNWLRGDSSDDNNDDSDDSTEDDNNAAADEQDASVQNETNTTNDENTTAEQQENNTENDSVNDDNETEAGNETDNGNETDERQARPSDEDTEIDHDQYNQSESNETEDLPQSYVEIPRDDVTVTRDSTNTIAIEATITNTSDQDIDFVDVEIIYLENGTRVGTDIEVVEDLAAGESEQFSTQTSPVSLRGDPTDVDFNPLPQNYV